MTDPVAAQQRRVTLQMKSASGEVLEYSLRPDAIPFRERALVRKATGLPYESFLGDEEGESVGLDTIQIWWWLAKRGSNPLCTLDQALADWPDDIEPESFNILMDDGVEESDPEASGPVSSSTGPTSPTTSDSSPETSPT